MRGYRDPRVAGLLSALLPGAGQVYAGEGVRGLTFLLGTGTGLFLFIVPGVPIWITAVVDAVAAAHRRNHAPPPEVPGISSPLVEAAAHVTDGPPPETERADASLR